MLVVVVVCVAILAVGVIGAFIYKRKYDSRNRNVIKSDCVIETPNPTWYGIIGSFSASDSE